MNTTQLLPRLKASFAHCSALAPQFDMIRCERIYNDHPRSVYFFRGTELLPDDLEMKRILSEVVSPSYFRASDASRWSHYVVFVASDGNKTSQTFRQRQREIEEDKSYARKLVVFASEFDAFVDHSFGLPSTAAPSGSVAEIWTQKLQASGLGQIQSREARAPIVRAIRSGHIPAPRRSPAPVAPKESAPAPMYFLKVLEVDRFANRQIHGAFRFARVNLIRGPNGSGKTSLLEAIEHYFCGATYRSRGGAEEFDARAIFTHSDSPVPYRRYSNPQYQAKDQRWYGRTYNRGNRLWEGFSRFNFLNTNAAVEFSMDGDLRNLTEVLSKIALGPDAAHTWTRIGEFEGELTREIRPIETTLKSLSLALQTSKARLASLAVASPQLEAQLQTFLQTLQPLSWSTDGLPQELNADWFQRFNPLRGWLVAAEHAQAQSVQAITDSLQDVHLDLKRLGELETHAAAASRRDAELRRGRSMLEQCQGALQRLEQYFQAGFPALRSAEAALRRAQTELSRRLIPEADRLEWLQGITEVNATPSLLGECEPLLQKVLKTTRGELQETEHRRLLVEQRLRATDTVLADVRRLGRQYAEIESHARACPLCHTEMDMTELLSRIESITDPTGQSLELEALGRQVAELKQRVQRLTGATVLTMRIIEAFPDARALPVTEVSERLRRDQQSMESATPQLAQLQAQLTALGKSGFSAEEFQAQVTFVRTRLNGQQIPTPIDAETVHQLQNNQKTLDSELKLQEEELRAQVSREAAERLQIEGRFGAGSADFLQVRIQDRIRALQSLLDAFRNLPAPTQQRFSGDLHASLKLAREAARELDQLNVQAQAERARTSETKVLTDQISRDEAQQQTLTGEQQRLQAALSVLRNLMTQHSLESGLVQFLSGNLEAIQSIFSKIHVPHELRLSNLENCRLERVGSKGEVDLTQISTGQRAALMLSIFLSLNLSLRSGPPMMLIDDPIAHIDDLNALSFVDYLADLAESGRRQIFFATANDKLGNIFQKKMEFLGADLAVLSMKRDLHH